MSKIKGNVLLLQKVLFGAAGTRRGNLFFDVSIVTFR